MTHTEKEREREESACYLVVSHKLSKDDWFDDPRVNLACMHDPFRHVNYRIVTKINKVVRY